MPQIEHKELGLFNEYHWIQITLDDGFTCMLYFDPSEECISNNAYLVSLAEQRRETRSSWKMEDNIKRGYYHGES